jgi:Uma2 family endonuclease
MAHGMREIVLPETKPETEWLRGRAVRKMSPLRTHSRLQGWWLRELGGWAAERGEVSGEWRFRVGPPGEAIRPLVPDVAFLSYARMGNATAAELEAPLLPPNAAIEIRSPGDSYPDLEDKAATLLRAGTDVVVIVNPRTRTVIARDAAGKRIFSGADTFEHAALPGFTFPLPAMFDVLRVHRPSERHPDPSTSSG